MKRNSIAKRAGALVLCAALTAGSMAAAAGAAQSSSVTTQLSPNISIVVDGTERTFTMSPARRFTPSPTTAPPICPSAPSASSWART